MAIGVRIVGDVAVFDIVAEDLTRTSFAIPSLHDLVRTQLNAGKRKILINFEKAEFVDSSGVGQIIGSYTSTRNIGGAFKFCSVPQKVLLVFMIVGIVPTLIKVYPDEPSALASFAESGTPLSMRGGFPQPLVVAPQGFGAGARARPWTETERRAK